MTTAYDELLTSLGLAPSGSPPRPEAECGTYSGYNGHLRRKETPCQDCRTANTEYKRQRKHARKNPATMPPINHGTVNGARQHWYRGDKPCTACRDAYNTQYGPITAARQRDARAARKQVAA